MSRFSQVQTIYKVSVECHFLLPLWFVDNRLFDIKYGMNWFISIRIHTLDNIGSNDMGRLLSGYSWSPCFRIGVTSAIFQIFGKVPDIKESLIIAVTVGRNDDKQFLKTRTVILSFPGAFLLALNWLPFRLLCIPLFQMKIVVPVDDTLEQRMVWWCIQNAKFLLLKNSNLLFP